MVNNTCSVHSTRPKPHQLKLATFTITQGQAFSAALSPVITPREGTVPNCRDLLIQVTHLWTPLYAQRQKITPGIQAIAPVLIHSINISIRLLFCDNSKLIFTVCQTFFRVLCVCYSLNPHRDSML